MQRAVAWGWSDTRVLVMDEDLGQSGTTAEGRQGFQRLVAEVGLEQVGWVVGVAMSRVARSSTDWPQRLEPWALFGTWHALVRSLVQQGLELGVRRREGPAQGALEWRCPKRSTLHAFLKHPIDAGAYAYGRRQGDGRNKQPGRPSRGRVARPPQGDHVLLNDVVPASSTWEPYAQHLARLAANRAHAETLGAVRHGPALVAGVVVCGTCNHRLQVRYGGPRT